MKNVVFNINIRIIWDLKAFNKHLAVPCSSLSIMCIVYNK